MRLLLNTLKHFSNLSTLIIFLPSIFILIGCVPHTIQDGPPSRCVDVSKIPNASPKQEKLSRYGNMRSYRVFGKRYQVMRSAKNYQEQGLASWYGAKFNKHKTSSGERYDMLAMTAAHKTLPLPTYVEVTNLTNGNKVIVKVNDRGPFARNRIIDLSYVAAKKLGMVGHGTALVNVRAIDPNEAFQHHDLIAQRKKAYPPLYSVEQRKSVSPVYLQVGAFKNRLYAEKLKNRLSPLITSPVAIKHLAKHSKKLYRVEIGPIKTTAGAASIQKKLREIGLTAQHTRV